MRYFTGFQCVGCFLDSSFQQEFNQRWPDLYSIQYLFKGDMVFGRDGETPVVLTAPAIYWISPEHTYQLKRKGGGDHRHVVLFNGMNGTRLIREGFDELNSDGWASVAYANEVDTVFREMFRFETEMSPSRQARIFTLIEKLLIWVVEGREKTNKTDDMRMRIEKIAADIRENPFARHDPREMAKRAHLSYSHFRRLFRQYIKQAPLDYALLCRMTAAARKLREPGMRIQELALLAGYDDPSLFSRAFKKQMGLSPVRYRATVM